MKTKWRAWYDRCKLDGKSLNALLYNLAFWLITLLYLELMLHVMVFRSPGVEVLSVVSFTVAFAIALSLLCSLLPSKFQFPVMLVLTIALVVLYGSQAVYFFVFGSMYSVSQVKQGGPAVTAFFKEMICTMWDNIGWILTLLVPLALLGVMRWLKKDAFRPANGLWRLIFLGVMGVAYVAPIIFLPVGGTGNFTPYDYYYSYMTTTDQAARRFGLLTAFRLDMFPQEVPVSESNYYIPEGQMPQSPENYNVLEIDFDALNAMTEDERIIALNNYFAAISGTNRNEYTGMLSDYNLIVLCAESFSPAAIDPVRTPTLWKLAHEGIVFENYYGTYLNNTTNGEYTLCMGLYPDFTRGKSESSFFVSKANYVPFCLGNMFQDNLGIQTYGYHNYQKTYYGRENSHPNMGYEMKFAKDGMEFSTNWPSSDLEMMEQSMDDYLGQNQFHAYYMTFSGHMYYDPAVNPMANRNWEMVKNLPYSDPARSYISCNLELEKAMAYMMQRLGQAGVADKTAIVLAADHYPYGLTNEQYAELVDYDLDLFTKSRSNLIFWVGGLEENIVVEEYCSNADILPTILNLWGMPYDSRMLAGTDVFSDGDHVAILADKSFLTDKVWVNASTGEITYLVDPAELPEDYVDNMMKLVKTKIFMSADILNTDYYRFVFAPETLPVPEMN